MACAIEAPPLQRGGRAVDEPIGYARISVIEFYGGLNRYEACQRVRGKPVVASRLGADYTTTITSPTKICDAATAVGHERVGRTMGHQRRHATRRRSAACAGFRGLRQIATAGGDCGHVAGAADGIGQGHLRTIRAPRHKYLGAWQTVLGT